MRNKILYSTLTLLSISLQYSFADVDSLRSGVNSNANRTIELLKASDFHMQNHVLKTDKINDSVFMKSDIKLLKFRDSYLFEIDNQIAKEPNPGFTTIVGSSVSATNSKYFFTLLKPSGMWALSDLTLYSSSHSSVISRPKKYPLGPRDLSNYSLHKKPLTEALEDKNFSILSESPISESQEKYVFSSLEYSTKVGENWFVIDKSRGCSLVSYRVRSATEPSWVGEAEYELRAGPQDTWFLRESRITTKGRQNGNDFHREEVIKSEINFNPRLRESEFTLTAYGIPEPDGVVWDNPYKIYMWIGVALFVIFVSVAFARKAWKRK